MTISIHTTIPVEITTTPIQAAVPMARRSWRVSYWTNLVIRKRTKSARPPKIAQSRTVDMTDNQDRMAQALRELSAKWRQQGEAIGPSVGHLARTYCADDLDALLNSHASAQPAQPASVADGWVPVPVRLSAEQVSDIKDAIEEQYGFYDTKARP